MIWLVMILGGIFTFGTRFLMLSGWVAHGLPRWLIDALAFVPIAVLTAILVPVLIDPATQQIIVKGNARIVAAAVATIIALLTRNVIATIISGLTTLWFLQWWL